MSGCMDRRSPLTVAGAAWALSAFAVAPNSLLASRLLQQDQAPPSNRDRVGDAITIYDTSGQFARFLSK